MEIINTIGRRKSAIAKVYLMPGKGTITINDRDLKEYFTTEMLQYVATQPLNLLGVRENYDVKVNLNGGGFSGQAEALRLGISRALVIVDPENRPKLKQAGFMTRDPREVERKKAGQPKARKRFQFSKR
ncbi:MAG: 30S ribosomal protein S9 [Prolixibacteraceae bacterium]|jgi:small subunit ribosomal protein S9|nr:30S ribosomal protein S9 [Prolixibacteraceae bacterium]MDI9563987.1 30S ribosomal protein S9 [Bacteroidota bacterium]NLS99161.1 30S ribosomal protein S9 [Bacteroidales bacterium]OQB82176.1 MAG: 30S ribosomal protein S9 [Bacteroidetes bacterium ADurb.Bin123]HNZ69974.1 30S ribosomal protein S9 [Prolixibacteraceae bacterium]